MRNASEATPLIQRPDHSMSVDDMESEIQSFTLNTTFRAWFFPLSEYEEFDDNNGTGPYWTLGAMPLRGDEMEAVRAGTHIDYTIVETDYDCDIFAEANGKRIDVYEPDGFYAITLLSQGLPQRETLMLSDFTEITADPKDDFIEAGNVQMDRNDVEQLMGVCQRWLALK